MKIKKNTAATIHDIAKALNLSIATVSRALNDYPILNPKTKERVLQEVVKQNYHPNKMAASLRSGKSKLIGVMVPSLAMNFFANIIHGIEKIAFQYDYNVLLVQSNELPEFEQKGLLTLLKARVDVIMASVAKNTTDLAPFKNIIQQGVPLILFDRVNPLLKVPSVAIDDEQGAYEMTTALIHAGCKKIAHIAGPQHIPIFKNRLNGYLKALSTHHLKAYPEFLVIENMTPESGRRACEKLFQNKKNKPDGIFCVEDYTALGAIQFLEEAQIAVPQQVKIGGFANENFGEYLKPQLSTMDQFPIEIGTTTALLFFDLYVNSNKKKKMQKNIVLQPKMISRQSI